MAEKKKDVAKKKKDEKHPQCLFQFKGHNGAITCSRVSMTGKMVATTGEDRRINLWNISSLPPTQVVSQLPREDGVASAAFVQQVHFPDLKAASLAQLLTIPSACSCFCSF